MHRAWNRRSFMFVACVLLAVAGAVAGGPPSTPPQGECTLARQQQPGTLCCECFAAGADRSDCYRLHAAGFEHRCVNTSAGATNRIELWCRSSRTAQDTCPARPASPPPQPPPLPAPRPQTPEPKKAKGCL